MNRTTATRNGRSMIDAWNSYLFKLNKEIIRYSGVQHFNFFFIIIEADFACLWAESNAQVDAYETWETFLRDASNFKFKDSFKIGILNVSSIASLRHLILRFEWRTVGEHTSRKYFLNCSRIKYGFCNTTRGIDLWIQFSSETRWNLRLLSYKISIINFKI